MAENCSHNCSTCSSECSSRDFKFHLNPKSSVKKVIGVVSGKGGVGKSLVTALLASQKKDTAALFLMLILQDLQFLQVLVFWVKVFFATRKALFFRKQLLLEFSL